MKEIMRIAKKLLVSFNSRFRSWGTLPNINMRARIDLFTSVQSFVRLLSYLVSDRPCLSACFGPTNLKGGLRCFADIGK